MCYICVARTQSNDLTTGPSAAAIAAGLGLDPVPEGGFLPLPDADALAEMQASVGKAQDTEEAEEHTVLAPDQDDTGADIDLLPQGGQGTAPVLHEVDPIGFNAFFDIPGNTFTQVTLGVGTRINAEISATFGGADSDWFQAFFLQGQTYRITANSLDFFGFGLGDPRVALYDASGSLLTFDETGDRGADAVLEVTATRTGLYYIGVDSRRFDDIGQYEVALNQINLTSDTVGQTKATAQAIAVEDVVTGTIDTPNDEDWYKLRLEKGKVYAFEMDGDFLSTTPLGDPLIEIVSGKGELIAFNDDDGFSYNSFVTAEITKTGNYFFRAKSNSDTAGDFRLVVNDITPPEPPSPLDALDWGVKLDDTDVTYYLATAGETFGTAGKLGAETAISDWTDYEKGQAALAFAEYTKVSTLTFREVSDPGQADFKLVKGFQDGSLSGKMAPPDPTFDPDTGVGWFNTSTVFWSDEDGGLLSRGAYGLSNFMHEFGHGVGLSHPHDNGAGQAAIFDGVFASDDPGTFNLNQEVFTVMSYNKGWGFGPEGESGTLEYGIARSLMAFDIAALQDKYGANTDHKGGNSTYRLFTENGRGTGYEAIWDTGGRDKIVNPSGTDAIIDLRPATLKLEVGGGGFVSWVDGIFGGYTIANGVVIEDAVGGSGRDGLVGNGAGNRLEGKRGADTLVGFGGKDTLSAGSGADQLDGGSGKDKAFAGGGADTLAGGAGNDTLLGGGGSDRLEGGAGNDTMTGGKGADLFVFGSGSGKDTIKDFGKGADKIDLTALNFANFQAVKKLISNQGDDVLVDLEGAAEILLRDIEPGDLTAADFDL